LLSFRARRAWRAWRCKGFKTKRGSQVTRTQGSQVKQKIKHEGMLLVFLVFVCPCDFVTNPLSYFFSVTL
jgi:hypothetical protein